MSNYVPPLDDIRFIMNELAGLPALSKLPGCSDATPELAAAIFDEAGKFATGVLAPLNRVGDVQGARWDNGGVITPDGWKEAYRQFCEGGWGALSCTPEFGGQGLPRLISAPVLEMWSSANMAFKQGPLLTAAAIEALRLAGSAELRRRYLPKMVSGEWSGTMNLTEPQAGSDLSLVRSRAEPQKDGSYKVFGQKIFITYGEHDLSDNIIHLVLARTPEAPAGVKGISLFVVPKYLINDDGSLGARNDVHCVALEHKLGIRASPTAVLAYGDNGGATGYLVGEEQRGLEYMFVMMNEARFGVGVEGIAIAERAYQQARDYAGERRQGRDAVTGEKNVPIIRHPDVRRMLATMKARIEAARALAYCVAAMADVAEHHPDAAERGRQQAVVDLLIPVVKGCATEMGVEVASLGLQIHGGMGFIEETGAAQHLRDARITTIYEGTTGIQANDLIGRKIVRENAATLHVLMEHMRGVVGELAVLADLAEEGAPGAVEAAVLRERLTSALEALGAATGHVLTRARDDMAGVLVGAVPYLHLLGTVCGGWQTARSLLAASRKLAAGTDDERFCRAKLATALVYAEHMLSQAPCLADTVIRGAAGVLAITDEQF